jgi:hypothetical protein
MATKYSIETHVLGTAKLICEWQDNGIDCIAIWYVRNDGSYYPRWEYTHKKPAKA